MRERIITLFMSFVLITSMANATESTSIPDKIEYVTIKVDSVGDLQAEPDMNHVYTMDGLNLRSLGASARKKAFIKMLLPSIKVVNQEIDRDIQIVENLSKKSSYTSEEERELRRIFKNYKVSAYNWSALKKRMIKYPTSLILSQAALESGWGTSKIFRENNNIFGMVAYSSGGKYQKYDSIKDSVRDFILILSRVSVYEPLRKRIRAGQEPMEIAKGLRAYSTTKDRYVREVQSMMSRNNLERFD